MSHAPRFSYIALMRPLGKAPLAKHRMYNGSVTDREFVGTCKVRRESACFGKRTTEFMLTYTYDIAITIAQALVV